MNIIREKLFFHQLFFCSVTLNSCAGRREWVGNCGWLEFSITFEIVFICFLLLDFLKKSKEIFFDRKRFIKRDCFGKWRVQQHKFSFWMVKWICVLNWRDFAYQKSCAGRFSVGCLEKREERAGFLFKQVWATFLKDFYNKI